MSNYREVRKRTAEKMGDGEGDKLPCIRCQTPTDGKTLSDLGARCRACYEAYCREPLATRAGPDPKAVQRALPRREQRVTPGHIGELLAKKPTREQVASYAEDLGIDVGDQP